MMLCRILVAFAILYGQPAVAQTIKLPIEVKGEAGDFIRVPAETDGVQVRWYSPDKGLKLFPVDLLKDTKTAVAIAATAGRYRLVAWTAKGDIPSLPAECIVVIGGAPEPGPDPGPGPTPPNDPLYRALQSAWSNVPVAERPLRNDLASLYDQSANMLLAKRPDDPTQYITTYTTWAELLAHLKNASATLGLVGKVLPLHAVITAELKLVFPTDGGTPFTLVDRTKAADQFRRVATCLKGVK